MTDHNWIDVRTQEDAAQGVGRWVCSGCGMVHVNRPPFEDVDVGASLDPPAGPCTPTATGPTDNCPEFGVRDCTVPQWLREEAALCEAEDGKLAWWLLEAADMIDSLSADAARYRVVREYCEEMLDWYDGQEALDAYLDARVQR